MRVAVYGLWHLGCVTAACLAEAGHRVFAFDVDERVVEGLRGGKAPLHEPGLDDLLAAGLASGNLTVTADSAHALADADVVWVTFDTPVNDRDEADVPWLRERLERIAEQLRPGTVVLISSQAPAGFTRSLEADWAGRGLHFAYSPENLRLGKALEVFRKPDRVVVGVRDEAGRAAVEALLAPFHARIEWMTVESAEMTKHALNAFLATSAAFANELARLCESVGADAKEVERGLKSEIRIGPRAYLAPGAAFAGGTLARDLRYLVGFGERFSVATPLFDGVLASNEVHKGWVKEKLTRLLDGAAAPTVALLGLTYKPGTSTLRRSTAVEQALWLHGRGVRVRAHDPAVEALPEELRGAMELCAGPEEALAGADAAVVGTEWPAFRGLTGDQFVHAMRRPCVVDPNHFLAGALADDPRVTYFAAGRPAA
jgi:UDPglucose 6-dehydrogenase